MAFGRVLCAVVALGGWVAGCGKAVSGGDGESHFLKCKSDDTCRTLGTGFGCFEGLCRPASNDAGMDARSHDATTEVGDSLTADATPDAETGTRVLDAMLDVSDAQATPNCACPPGDYYLEVAINGAAPVRLSYAYPLSLYCAETEPSLAHPPCGSAYRLSACTGPARATPCVYLSVDGATPIAGFFEDPSGQFFTMVTAQIPTPVISDRLATGSFSALYASQTSEASISVTGTYHACSTDFGECRR
jgi:hypothetical protein